MKIKEFSIDIVVHSDKGCKEYTEDQIIDMLDDWCIKHNLTMSGMIKELK